MTEPYTYPDDLKMDLPSDRWGYAMAALFDVCDELYDREGWRKHLSGLANPSAGVQFLRDVRYIPGARPTRDERTLPDVDRLSYADLLKLGRVLNRYCDRLKHAGKDY